MQIFDLIEQSENEQVVFCNDPRSVYRGIIAIHNTNLGPALGGTRLWNYASDREAIKDVLRLARGMTYKAAVAGLRLGGGKAVIIGEPGMKQREDLFRAHGRFVETLKGRYITAEDVGTTPGDMAFVNEETEHVVGLEGRSGDPSPVTAYGTYRGIKASAVYRYGNDDLNGITVAVQGLGNVGYFLCKHLAEEGARLLVTDINKNRVKRVVDAFDATALDIGEIYETEAQIFAPCALGSVINDETLPKFRFDIIAGAANNQLDEAYHGRMLKDRGILYAPDYVINAGGLINVYREVRGWTRERAKQKADEIFDTLLQLYQLSGEEGIPTNEAADRLAERRFRGEESLSQPGRDGISM